MPVRTGSIRGPGEAKNETDKPEVPGRFEECEQGVHVVVPLTLQFARFRFLEEEVNNIKVRFLPSCFKMKGKVSENDYFFYVKILYQKFMCVR